MFMQRNNPWRRGKVTERRRRFLLRPGIETLEPRVMLAGDVDLRITSVQAPNSAVMHETIPVSWTQANTGTEPATALWFDRIYLSSDEVYDPDDVQAGVRNYRYDSALGGGDERTVQENIVVPPTTPGDQFLLVVIDRNEHQEETDETNNVFAQPINIASPDVDLVMTSPSAPTAAVAGERIQISWTVENQGTESAIANSWTDRVYVSADETLDEADRNIAAVSSSGLTPLGGSASYTRSFQISLNADVGGDQFLLFETNADMRQAETDSTNNVASLPIRVDVPNLTITDATSPASATAGEQVTVTWTVQNTSAFPTGSNWYDGVYFSEDDIFDNQDTQLTSRYSSGVTPVDPGSSYTQSLNVSLTNAPLGDGFLLFVADKDDFFSNSSNVQLESDETDNVIARPISITGPDLTIPNASAPPTGVAGGTIELSWTVANEGAAEASADWYDYIYVSADEVLDNDDLLVQSFYQGQRTPMGANSQYAATEQLELRRVPAGDQFLLIEADGNRRQRESDEDNNVISLPITITAPNLTVSDASAPASAISGQQITVEWTVANDGTETAGADWYDVIYLSPDETLDAADQLLTNRYAGSFTPLDAGESYVQSVDVSLNNVAPGDQFLLIRTDNNDDQGETDEADNVLVRPISITAPNVVATAFDVAETAVSGSSIEVTWTVENQGIETAECCWTDAFYLSEDPIFDASDLRIGDDGASAIAPGESYSRTKTVTLSQVRPGMQYVLLVVDAFEDLGETDETDNVLALPIDVAVPNLMPTAIGTPLTITSGNTVSINWTVTNDSEHPAKGSWQDRMYLSRDDLFDSGDTYLAAQSVSASTPINPGENYTANNNVRFSRISPGDYFLIVVANYSEGLAETNDYDNAFATPVTITVPDVEPTVFNAPDVAIIGEQITLSWTVANTSSEVVGTSWSDRVYLSDDAILDTSVDRQLTSSSNSASIPLNPGESYSASRNTTLGALGAGDKFLILAVDATNSQYESDEANNNLVRPISLSAPDLSVSDSTSPATAIVGEQIELTWTVTNIGDVTASANWQDRIYLSNDDAFDGADQYVTFASINSQTPLAAGDSYTETRTVTIPNAASGDHFLLFVTDSFNNQGETDETNNTRAVPIALTVPDLIVASATAPDSVDAGDSIEVTWTVTNQGSVPAPANWNDAVYLSQDNTLQSSDQRLSTFSINAETPLAVGASYTRTQNISVSGYEIPAGNQFLLFVADYTDQQGEADETNNVFAWPIEVRSPDLIVTDITAPDEIKSGQEFEMSWTVQNVGNGTATADWYDFIAISTDQELDCPFECGEFDIDQTYAGDLTPLAPGESYTQTMTFTTPQSSPYGEQLTPGRYFLGVKADENYGGDQPEANESNNQRFKTITVLPPDVDLIVSAATAPGAANLGDTIQVEVTITNQGTEPATGEFDRWFDNVSLSDDDQPGSDRSLASRSNTGELPLDPGASYTFTLDVEIYSNLEAGDKFLLFQADTSRSQVETDELNNFLALPISISAPNLTITDISAPDVAALSQSLSLSWTVQNDGDVPALGDWSDSVYLSDDEVFDFRDRFVTNFNAAAQSPLVPGGTYTSTRNVSINNTTAGTKFLLFVVDSSRSQGETDEDDNVIAHQIELASADLVLIAASGPTSIAAGETFDVSRTIRNAGVGPAPANWTDAVYLSSDSVLDNDDLRIGNDNPSDFIPLAVDAQFTAPITTTMPSVTPGDYFLIVKADAFGAQTEISENNNIKHFAVTVIAPDLTVSDATAPATATVNETISVSYTVTNGPEAVAAVDWQDGIYLSTDDVLDNSDRRIHTKSVTEQTPLAATGSYTVTADVTLPGLDPGDYFLLFETNSNGAQAETDLTNNVLASAITLDAPNLIVAEAVAPANGLVNERLEVSFTVRNDSDVTAFGNWTDAVWLSTDDLLDNDRLLKSESINEQTPLAGNTEYTVEAAIALPKDLFGELFLIFEANNSGQQGETNLGDNTLAIPISIPEPPNLVVSDFTAPSLVGVHEQISVSFTVTNIGTTPAVGDWLDRIRLQTENDPAATGFNVGSETIVEQTPLGPGESYTVAALANMLGVAGDYFLMVRTNDDQVQGETSYDDNHLLQPISIVAPDLTISDPSAPAEGVLGQTIDVSYTVSNISQVAAVAEWQDRVYLSSDEVLDATDVGLLPIDAPKILPAGDSYAVGRSLTLPRFPLGNQFLIFKTDNVNQQTETDDDNNVSAAVPILLRAPDLTISDVLVPAEAISGQAFNVTWTVTNSGDAPASNWSDRVFLSTDAGIGADLNVGDFPFSGTLNPGESVTRTQGVTPPISLSGTRFVVVEADSGAAIIESDELNNATISDESVSVILAPIPDLEVSNITTSATGRELYQYFNVDWVVTNNGTGATNASHWRDRVYLSPDQSFDATDILIGDVGNPTFLNDGESYAGTANVRAGLISEGDYYILIFTDAADQVEEYFNEGDNITVGPVIHINFPPPPDLVVTNVAAPETAFSGQRTNITYTVENQGDAIPYSPWRDLVYMSEDETLDANDRLVGAHDRQTLYQVVQTTTYTESVEGAYLYCFGEPLPDPAEEVLYTTPNRDVAYDSLRYRQQRFDNFADICHENVFGGNTSFSRVHRSQTYRVDLINQLLAVGERYTTTVSASLPIAVTGDFYFFVLTDGNDQVNEFAFDTNNENYDQTATTVQLTPPPDLEVLSVEAAEETFQAGHSATFTYSVANFGSTRTPNTAWTDSLYLSMDDVFDPSEDTRISNRTISYRATQFNGYVGGLDVDGEYTREVTATIPNGLSGTYRVFAVADRPDQVFELDNDNNILGSAPFEITHSPPDLEVTSITVNESSLEAGGSALVEWTVTNIGTGDTIAGAWTDRVYLSTDDQIGGDRTLAPLTYRGGRLNPGESYTQSLNVQIPLDVSGPINLYVKTDVNDSVKEFAGEDNNTSSLVAANVLRETADLGVTPGEFSAADGRVRLRWRVENQGASRTDATAWRDAVYLSTNDTFGDGDEIQLATKYRSRALDPGQSYSVDDFYEVPLHLNAPYFFFVVADAGDAVDEDGSKANNVALLTEFDTSTLRQFPDLVIQSVDAPLEAVSGQFFDVTWTVQNKGTPIVDGTNPPEYRGGQWNDAVYLSADQVLEANTDIYLGSTLIDSSELVLPNGLGIPYQEYTVTQEFRIPSGVTGPLYVLVLTDRNQSVIEIDAEDNNIGFDEQSLFASLADPVDLVLGVVNVPDMSAELGGAFFNFDYTIENQGANTVAGRWSDRMYLSTDDAFSVDDVPFRVVHHGTTVIEPGGSKTIDTSGGTGTIFASVLPGDYHIIARTDIFNAIPESSETNNINASLGTFDITVPEIVIEDGTGSTEIEADISNNYTRTFYYQFDATEGQTLSLEAHGVVDEAEEPEPRRTVTTAYVALGRVPTKFDFDFRETRLLTTSLNNFTEQPLILPRTETGTYYIRVDVRDTHFRSYRSSDREDSHERFNLEINVLPFSITDVSPADVGNAGAATVEVTASNFNVCSVAELLRDGAVVRTSQQIRLIDSSRAFVTFDFTDLEPGTYDLRLTDHDGASATHAIEVVPGIGARSNASLRGPARVRFNTDYTFNANYGNNGDADGYAPLLLITNLDNNPFSVSQDGVRERFEPGTVVQSLGISTTGAAGTLRPGQLGSIPVFFRTDGTPGRYRMHTITADDDRPIDPEIIDGNFRPADLSDQEWDELKPLLIERVGSTWGSYVRALSDVATYLGDIGARTSSVSIILSELIRQVQEPDTVSLSGHIVSGSACDIVPNPLVRARSEDGTLLTAFSNVNGQFRFPATLPGSYTIAVDSDGFARQVLQDVALGSDPVAIAVDLRPEATITGVITLADGAVNTGRIGIGAQLDSLASLPEGHFSTSIIGGEFSLGGLPSGDYLLDVSLFGYLPQQVSVFVAPGETVDLGSITLLPAGSAAGVVTSNVEGIVLDDLLVGAFLDGELVVASAVDELGQFEILGLAAGTYELEVVNPVLDHGYAVGISSTETVTLDVGQAAADISLSVFAGATISGTVTDSSDSPLTSVLVVGVGPDGKRSIDYTDETGAFRFTNLKLGDYRVSLQASDSASTVVTVDDIDGATFTTDLRFDATTRITGQVTDAAGNSLVGTHVMLRENGTDVVTTRTDEDGTYTFMLLRGGEFELVAFRDGASFPVIIGVSVSADEVVQRDIVAGGRSLTVNVANGANDGRDVLFLSRVAGDDRIDAASAFVGESGSVQFNHLVPGDYLLRAVSGTDRVAQVIVSFGEDESPSISVTLATGNSVAADITDETGAPVPNAFVSIYEAGTLRAVGVTDELGRHTARGIVSGVYDLVVFAEGFAAHVISGLSVDSDIEQTVSLATSSAMVTGVVAGSDGDRVAHASVEVVDAAGRLLGFADVDSNGTFRITTAIGSNLKVVVRAAGHAEQVVEVVEIPTDTNVDLGSVILDPVAITQGTGSQELPDETILPSGVNVTDSEVASLASTEIAALSLPSEVAEHFEQNPQIFAQMASGSYAGGLLTKMALYTFNEGDFSRLEAAETPASAIVPLPDNCNGCASLRNQAVVAQQAQGIRAEIAEILDSDLFYQRSIVVGLFGLEFTSLTVGVVGLVTAALSLAPFIAALTAIVSGAGATVSTAGAAAGVVATGTSATGLSALSGTVILQTLVGVVGKVQSLSSKASSLATAPDTATAKQTASDVKGAISDTTGLVQEGITLIQNANLGSVGSSVGNFFGIVSVMNGIESFLNNIQFTNTQNALGLLEELELNMIEREQQYKDSRITASNKLMAYLACIPFPEDCANGPSGGGGPNGPGGPDGPDGPNPPTPPNPSNDPEQLNPEPVQSADPNDILGPEGFGEEGWIPASDTLPYMIRFENIPEATAPAQRVTVEQTLDDDLDPRTFRIDDFGWGEQRTELAGDQPFFQGRIELAGESGLVVDVTATVDLIDGIITWVLQTIDPLTGEAPADALAGFLPPNDPKGVGEGFVTYTIRPRRNSASGTRIDADATIVFDTNEAIDTPDIFNTLDAVEPMSQVVELPPSVPEPNFTVTWSGEDDETGSAIADFTIYVSKDGGPREEWLVNTTLTEAVYTGETGHTYAFVSIARDKAGNDEDLSAEYDTQTLTSGPADIGDFVWQDNNADGDQDEGEPGLEDITVKLLDASGEELHTTTTNASGFYLFESIDTAVSYGIEVVAPDGFAFSPIGQGEDDTRDSDADPETGRIATFAVTPGDNLQWDAGLIPLGSISGIVWNDADGNGKQDDGESPLTNWTVYIDADESGELTDGEQQAMTGDDGSYEFDDLLPGSHVVGVVLQDGWSQIFPGVTGASSIATGSLAEAASSSRDPVTSLIELDTFRGDSAFSTFNGGGYSVVVIDSGIDVDHLAFGPDMDGDGVADRIVFQYDFADDDDDASDRTGHGSHLASVIAANGELTGIAGDANIIALKVFGDDGRGYFSDVEQALQWVIENAGTYNVAAVNLSFGDGNNWDTATSQYGLGDELSTLGSMGVITVSAAGNNYGYFDSTPGVQYPAADPNVIAVGAVWADDRGGPWLYGTSGTDNTTGPDRIVSFSQRHDELIDTFAPGGLVTGANAFGSLSKTRGTSHAVPFVTGAAVLVQQIAVEQLGRRLTLDEFRRLLRETSATIIDGDDEDDNVENTGQTFSRLDLHALALAVRDVEPSAASPTPLPAASSNHAIGTLAGQPFTYTIDLAAGQNRTEVDFGVADQTPPTLANLPADVTVEATGPDGAVVTFDLPTATDGVDVSPTVVCSHNSGSAFPIGATTVTCSATDEANNEASASFQVTVRDTMAPTLSGISADITVEATGPSGATIEVTAPSAADTADPNPTVACSAAGLTTFGLGTTTVTCNATDRAGNQSAASYNVRVVDTTPPMIEAGDDLTVETTAPAGVIVTFDLPAATDVVDTDVAVNCSSVSGVTFPLGQTLVTCTATDDAGNSASASFNVTVTGDFEIDLDYGDAPQDYPVTIANDGARHQPVSGGPFLGAIGPDQEVDGQPSADASGDAANVDDEESLTPLTTIVRSSQSDTIASLDVVVTMNGADALLNGWIDFNRDGDWDEDGEQVFANESVVDGANTLNFVVPAGSATVAGGTFLRLRLSSDSDLTPRGLASDGEVEDHLVAIVDGDSPVLASVNLPTSGGPFEVRSETGNTQVRTANGLVLFQAPAGSLSELSIIGTPHADTINVVSTAAASAVNIEAGAGNDIINIGDPAGGSLDEILGMLHIDGGDHLTTPVRQVRTGAGGVTPNNPYEASSEFIEEPPVTAAQGDTLNINDANENEDIRYDFALNGTQEVQRRQQQFLDYAGIELTELTGGSGVEAVVVELPEGGWKNRSDVFVFDGRDGNDILKINGSAASDDILIADKASDPGPRANFEVDDFLFAHLEGDGGDDNVINDATGLLSLLEGNAGDDVLIGSDHVDVLFGGGGTDALFGREGDDFLFGELDIDGNMAVSNEDRLDGGPGADKGLGVSDGVEQDVLVDVETILKETEGWQFYFVPEVNFNMPAAADIAALRDEALNELLSLGGTQDWPTVAEQLELIAVDQSLGLHTKGTLYENWGGLNEKWLQGADDEWYYVTPDGNLYAWHGGEVSNATLIDQVGVARYEDPALLYSAADTSNVYVDDGQADGDGDDGGSQTGGGDVSGRAAALDEELDLFVDNLYLNWGGLNEKWLRSNAYPTAWYYITPNGDFYEWHGGGVSNATLRATLDASYYNDLELLHDAFENASNGTGGGDTGGGDTGGGDTGGGDTGGGDTGGGDADALRELAVQHDRELGLYFDGQAYLNWGGIGETWLRGKQQIWYYLTPSGDLYRSHGGNVANATHLVTLAPEYHANPSLLYNAVELSESDGNSGDSEPDPPSATELDEQLGLFTTGNLYVNWGGWSEKWVEGRGQKWYFILSDGSFFEWHGGTIGNSTKIYSLDAIYYVHPELLYDSSTA